MGKILVAGAGHGGLTAAINLAKNGYNVTVIEEKPRNELGHDWHDSLNMSAFDMSGIDRPRDDMYSPVYPHAFKNPSATKCIQMPKNETSIFMDRKVLISYLLECAEQAGVKLVFGHKILSPIVHSTTVKGLNIDDGKKKYKLAADLVIDAAGMYSPVRSNLPSVCNIQRKFEEKSVFHVFRAYYRNNTGEATNPPYIINLFHMNRPGIDWTITNKDYIDILIGKFSTAGALTQEEVNETLNSFKKDYPYIDDCILRGGTYADIPLTKMLPIIVCNGYAAVGDSAGMTMPLSGSGIVLSMKAGKILADTVIKANGTYDRKSLWHYEYEYFRSLGQELLIVDILKNFVPYIKGEQVDLLLESEFLTKDAMAFGKNHNTANTLRFLRHAVSSSNRLYKLTVPFLRNFKSLPLLPLVSKGIPKEYDESRVNSWSKLYSAL